MFLLSLTQPLREAFRRSPETHRGQSARIVIRQPGMDLHLWPARVAIENAAAGVPFVCVGGQGPEHQRTQFMLHHFDNLIWAGTDHHHELRKPSRRSL